MPIFVDTSALLATLTGTDRYHQEAREAWSALRAGRERLETSNYILLETAALVGRRLGMQALREFQAAFVPLLRVHWVDEELHERGMAALLTVGLRDLSLVDTVSFEIMRQQGLNTAFTFDAHFRQQGFRLIP